MRLSQVVWHGAGLYTLDLAKPKSLSTWEWQWDQEAARHTGTPQLPMQHLRDRSHNHRNRTITSHPTETPEGRKTHLGWGVGCGNMPQKIATDPQPPPDLKKTK